MASLLARATPALAALATSAALAPTRSSFWAEMLTVALPPGALLVWA